MRNTLTFKTSLDNTCRSICLVMLTLLLFSMDAMATTSFITTWKTDNVGGSNNTSLIIPTNPNYTYNYDVDWDNDGTFDDLGLTGDASHDYGTAGTYQIAIRGTFPAIYFKNGIDPMKILNINQWGNIDWKSFESAFFQCRNLNMSATDIPDLNDVTNMSEMFYYAYSFNGDVSNWNVSNVTNMSKMFWRAYSFNANVSNWNVSSLVNMSEMFFTARSFNIDLSTWDVSSVTNMSFAFSGAEIFNGDVSTWDVSNVTNMKRLFGFTDHFNGDLSTWVVSNVTNMEGVFTDAKAFNGDISNWDVSSVTNMAGMFSGAAIFNGDISDWDVSNVTNMTSMFQFAPVFNSDLSTWDVSSLTNMFRMFRHTSFSGDISSWDVSSVTNMEQAFYSATAFNSDVSAWDVSSVTNMYQTFYSASSFNSDLSNWDISNVTNMNWMLAFTNLSIPNYDAALTGWANLTNPPSGITFSTGGLIYCTSVAERNSLISNHGWTILGDTGNCSPTYFTTTWKTDNVGIGGSNNTSVIIPTYPGYTYNYDVDWDNDGVFDEFGLIGDAAHDYGTVGTYSIAIRGAFPTIYFKNSGDRNKILDINQWGTGKWETFEGAFLNCSNLTLSATDVPDLDNVTNMSEMFGGAVNFNGNLSNWNVSNVTDMYYMLGSTIFDGNLSNWNVSNVTNMARMFSGNSVFNGNVSTWDVSNVTDMKEMFAYASTFSGDLSTWDVSNVTDMSDMFNLASAFNSDLSNWDVSNVTNMSFMFTSTPTFNSDLSSWDVVNVTSMAWMFRNSAFSGDISAWNVSNVTNMTAMFNGNSVFNSDLSNWNVSNVMTMLGMFNDAHAFDSDLSSWDVSSVTSMAGMFYNAYAFDSDLSSWDVINVTEMDFMFNNTFLFDSDLSAWNISNVTNMTSMLSNSGLSTANYDATITGWANMLNPPSNINLGALNLTYCASVADRNDLMTNNYWSFTGDSQSCTSTYFISEWKTDNFGTSNNTSVTIPTHPAYTYSYDVDWNNDGIFDDIGVTGNITHDYGTAGTYEIAIRGTFPSIYFNNGGDKLKIKDIKQWGTIDWQSFEKAFYGCGGLSMSATDTPDLDNVSSMSHMFYLAFFFNGDLSGWDVSNVTNMAHMFDNASAFTSDLSNWDVSSVTDMNNMFYFASVFNSDLSTWDVSSVTSAFSMFRYASAFNSDLTNWDVSNITFLSYMFGNTNAFNGDLANWDVSNATDMGFMFFQAISFNQDLSNWDVSNVTGMSNMFNGASAFDQNLSSWDVSALSYSLAMDNMLSNSNLSTANYDAVLTAWAQLPTPPSNISLGATGLTYCASTPHRNDLIVLHGWTITGDSELMSCLTVTPAVVGVCQTPSNSGTNTFVYNSQTSWHRFFSANGSQVFCEVGTNEDLGNVNVNVYDAAAPRSATANGAILGRNFTIDVDNQPVSPVKIRLYFTNGQFSEVQNAVNGGVPDPQSLAMTKFSSNNCSPSLPGGTGTLVMPDTYGTLNGGYYLEFTVNSFSEFFIHENTGANLPVEMTYFEAEKQNQSAYLTWNTASEQSNLGFHIERSTDGNTFDRIDFVQGAGDSTEPLDYSYLDRNPITGINYYRISQEDFDGKTTYSDIRQIHFANKTSFLLYPNPAEKADQVTLETHAEQGGTLTIQIISADGKQTVFQQREIIEGENIHRLDISDLPTGIHFVRLTMGEESQTIRLVK